MLKKLLMSSVAAVAMTVASLSGSPAQAAGQETSPFTQINDWSIYVDHTMGNGCFAVAEYKRGTQMRIGLDNKEKAIYFMFGNKNWSDMDVGKSYAVRFTFDDGTYFDGSPSVIRMKNSTFLAIQSHAEFLGAFAKRNTLMITMQSNGKQLAFVNLTGTYAAAMEVFRCQGIQDGRTY